MSTTTTLICSECGVGNFHEFCTYALCSHCGDEVDIDADIARHLDEGQRLTTTRRGLLAVITEED